MERRDFLKNSSLASSLFMIPSFVKAFENTANTALGYRKLVIIQLSGGNDGLNTIVPYRNDIYYNKRPKLAITKSEVLNVDGDLGMHPSLEGLKRLYDKGFVSIINNVGYPNPNRSHFRATDIWQTASDSDKYIQSGWIGRYLDNYGDDPYKAIEVDSHLSLALKGVNKNGIATDNARMLFNTSREPYFNKLETHNNEEHLNEHNLGYLYKTMIDARSSAKYIYQTSKTHKSKEAYPDNPFAKQLKTTAEFINSGLKTKVYYTSLGGFDTHANQKVQQQRLLKVYADSIEAFVKDLEKNDTFKDTLILTFSEFGRRVQQNAGNGTDHGTASNVYIIGKNLNKAGFYNNTPDLKNLDANGDLKFEVDFRRIYATVLNKWLEVNDKTILNSYSFDKLNFI
ncbi:DUF1501 domain-containing protein [Urechidicola vernalis]|uniref:DUF1501 domain-containing protein n=1 Tax=Urechidicola vernalis TaxID=3075600 RepID=A0ABU2Y4E1_9FLAO|nr:DUF1501 domain-containing protein [Urechidicola sp. P050]MDT0552524.1 DUF1501 domain-containing protein [Urechidicola sp. P050]